MVNAIHLTMTSKDQIETWKANRRKLVCRKMCYLKFLLIYLRHTRPLEHLTTLLQKYSFRKAMEMSAIGGR